MIDEKAINTYRSLLNSGISKLSIINSKSIQLQNKRTQQKKGQKSIIQKLIENKLNCQIEYQDRLIQIKELQLKLLDAQQTFNNLNKSYKKQNQKVIDLKHKLQNQKQVHIQKQKYLQNYYAHLDGKFKSNINSQLFGKLQKLELILQEKYAKLKQQLSDKVNAQNQKANEYNEQLQTLRIHRNQLTKSILNKAFDQSERVNSQYHDSQVKFKVSQVSSKINNTSIKSSQQRRKQQYRKRKQQIKQERENLKRNIKKLKKQKQNLEGQQKLLKLLLNIDEQHKKHSYLIINGLRKMIMINHRNCLFKKIKLLKQDSPSKQYLVLKEDVNMKIQQRNIFKQQLTDRINNLQAIKQKLNQEIGEYSQLQTQIMRSSNRISHDQLYNEERQSYREKSENNQRKQ